MTSLSRSSGKRVDDVLAKIEEKFNKIINTDLEKERERLKQSPISKILLLGPGDSGKSTVLKQMKILHGDGFSDKDRRECKPKMMENVVKSAKLLVNFLELLKVNSGQALTGELKVIYERWNLFIS